MLKHCLEFIFWLAIFWLPYILLVINKIPEEKETSTKRMLITIGMYMLLFVILVAFFLKRVVQFSVGETSFIIINGGVAIFLSILKVAFG
jgi:hypothetical protein